MSDIKRLLESIDSIRSDAVVEPAQLDETADLSQLIEQLTLEFTGAPPSPGATPAPGTPPAPGAAPATGANAAANTAPATTNTTNQQPNPIQQQQDQKDLTANLQQLKTLNPQINPMKAAQAMAKDPKQLGPADAQALDSVANTLKGALTDKSSLSQMRSIIQRVNGQH
jgi:chemotaxis protein histidine kinase CheA